MRVLTQIPQAVLDIHVRHHVHVLVRHVVIRYILTVLVLVMELTEMVVHLIMYHVPRQLHR